MVSNKFLEDAKKDLWWGWILSITTLFVMPPLGICCIIGCYIARQYLNKKEVTYLHNRLNVKDHEFDKACSEYFREHRDVLIIFNLPLYYNELNKLDKKITDVYPQSISDYGEINKYKAKIESIIQGRDSDTKKIRAINSYLVKHKVSIASAECLEFHKTAIEIMRASLNQTLVR